jgi:hypothetical protein
VSENKIFKSTVFPNMNKIIKMGPKGMLEKVGELIHVAEDRD